MEKHPILYTVKFALAALACALIIFGLGSAFTSYVSKKSTSDSVTTFDENSGIVFVLDAGHGGEDAGAVAADGTLEKDLNLEITLLLSEILELNGNKVRLTRSEDTLLYDHYNDLDDYTGQKKVYDLRNRLKIAQERENSIYVGLHMNKFAQEKYRGLQVYYSPNNDLSYQIATDIKESVKTNLQPYNNREIKRADSSIYILNRAEMPSVLIECGFISNLEELSLLKSEDYQKALSISIFSALIKHSALE